MRCFLVTSSYIMACTQIAAFVSQGLFDQVSLPFVYHKRHSQDSILLQKFAPYRHQPDQIVQKVT
jgi:hypothetical protein